MKKLITLICIAFAGSAFAADYTSDNISFQNGIYVDAKSQPITGTVTGPAFSTTLDNGIHNGKAKFYRNSRLAYEVSGVSDKCPLAGFDASKYADCIADGEVKVYDIDGMMIMRSLVKNRAITNLSYEDDQLISEETRVDSRLEGLATYYIYGRKSGEVLYNKGTALNIKEFHRDGSMKYEVRKDKGQTIWAACYDREGTETVLSKDELEVYDSLGGYLSCGTSDSEEMDRQYKEMYDKAQSEG